jgi:D-glycero-D-manno-heptose 1,7-bisphosphate phosphatase
MTSGHMDENRRAIFLDRDGTLTHPYHYPSRPEHLRLYDGIGLELARLQAQGFRLVVITNQSGLARGYFTEDDLARMHDSLIHELARWQVHLDAIYYCPHHIDGTIPALTRVCTCRKPQPGMLWCAASDLTIDLKHSWFVGDILDDVEAGNRAGCHTVLVDVGTEKTPTSVLRTPMFVARDTVHALRLISTITAIRSSMGADLTYRPSTWTMLAEPPMSADDSESSLPGRHGFSSEVALCDQ